MDDREDEVADLARRAALAASEKRRRQREHGVDVSKGIVDDDQMVRLESLLQQVGEMETVVGVMMTRGQGAIPIASVLPTVIGDEIFRTLNSIASTTAHQSELLGNVELGAPRDSLISLRRGAVLTRWIGEDLLLVAVEGTPAPVSAIWQRMQAISAEVATVCAHIAR